jgi:hypothetical protein
LDSTILLGRRLNQRVAVWWDFNSACSAGFLELFEPVPEIDIQSKIADVSVRFAFSERRSMSVFRRLVGFSHWGEALEGKLDSLFYGNREPLKLNVIRAMSRKDLICIRSDAGWFYPENFEWLVPILELRSRIEAMSARFEPGTVGIHIRRGDHYQAIAANPLNGFLAAIVERLRARPETRFFLSTEEPNIREQVRRVAGNSILTHEQDTSRTTLKGMMTAVVDLFCLSNCSEIWGTYGSSFSETAHHLRKAPLSYPAHDHAKLQTPLSAQH